MGGAVGALIGAVLGVLAGSADLTSSITGAGIGTPVGCALVAYQQNSNRPTQFDTERFLEDIHELPSAHLTPAKDREYFSGGYFS